MKMMSSNVIVGVLNGLGVYFITKIYSPEDFGAYQTIFSLVAIATVGISFKYDFFVSVAKRNEERNIAIIIAFIILTLISNLIIVFYYIFADQLRNWFSINIDNLMVFLLPLVFLSGFIQLCSSIYVYNKDFKLLAKFRVLQSSVQNTLMLVLGVVVAQNALIIALLITQIILSVYLYHSLSFIKNELKTQRLSLSVILNYEKEKRNYSILTTINSFLNVLSMNLPYIIMPYVFDLAYVGIFAISLKIMDMPIGLITSSISNVYIRYASLNEKSTYSKYVETIRSLIPISCIYILMIGVFSLLVSGFIFDGDWTKVKDVLLIMLIPKVAQLINSPVSSTLTIINKQMLITFLIIIFMPLRFISLYFVEEFYEAIIWYAFFTALYYISVNLTSFWVLKSAKK
ncbi:lipopolysaccharide biosynthesis protein [Vibrio lentus]|uniref:lipopolysaccharide biosynthesis protein n=1 Tax=Vibrio lentus TaxID=136468 RepID=UPI000CB2984A|nr:oligosaccharide flippase family protein [Vibrio lentus]PMI86555.1 hypothetical protein BCU35_14745 [Vibrio lentus]